MLNGLAGHEYAASVNVWILGGGVVLGVAVGFLVLAKGWMFCPHFFGWQDMWKTTQNIYRNSISIVGDGWGMYFWNVASSNFFEPLDPIKICFPQGSTASTCIKSFFSQRKSRAITTCLRCVPKNFQKHGEKNERLYEKGVWKIEFCLSRRWWYRNPAYTWNPNDPCLDWKMALFWEVDLRK